MACPAPAHCQPVSMVVEALPRNKSERALSLCNDRAVDLNAFLTKWGQRAVLDRQCTRRSPKLSELKQNGGPLNVSSVWVCARGDPLFRMIRIQAHLASQRVLMASYAFR